MLSKEDIEDAHFRLLSLEFASQITAATNLSRLRKRAAWCLPLRSSILCVCLKLAEGYAQTNWMITEEKIYTLGEPSVDVLASMHKAEKNKNRLVNLIKDVRYGKPLMVAVELSVSYIVLLAIGALIA
jgi:hypothetical protein